MCKLADESRLAGAGLAGQENERAFTPLGVVEQLPQRRELVRAADKRKWRGRQERPREQNVVAGRAQKLTREVEGRILCEHLPLEVPECRTRLDAELVERRARRAVGIE